MTSWLAGACAVLALVVVAREGPDPGRPSRHDVEAWLGRYVAGHEILVFRWDHGFVVDLDRISVPVDGRWHETVATFAVKHRLTWVPDRGVVTVEEQHNEGAHWRYELRQGGDGQSLHKLDLSDSGIEATVVRTYFRQSGDRRQSGDHRQSRNPRQP